MNFWGVDPSVTGTAMVCLDGDGEHVGAWHYADLDARNGNFGRVADLLYRMKNEPLVPGFACIESYGFASFRLADLVEVGTAARLAFTLQGCAWLGVAPNQLKKFATGDGKSKKNIIAREVYKSYGFEHDSDDVVDAYVLAQIARAMVHTSSLTLTSPQIEVIGALRAKARKPNAGWGLQEIFS